MLPSGEDLLPTGLPHIVSDMCLIILKAYNVLHHFPVKPVFRENKFGGSIGKGARVCTIPCTLPYLTLHDEN